MRLSAPVDADDEDSPLGPAEFGQLMQAVGPFEARPAVAVGVSGGADSLALALLLHDWARARDGRAVALTVDHGLRAEAAAEARQVARWLGARSVDHRILRWDGPRPQSGVQEAARRARYGLMGAWCRQRGVLHLAVAHHREDQAETFLLRLARGSGMEGLAAMPAVGSTPLEAGSPTRLLRPLLAVPKARLVATLEAAAQPWIEDPSNEDIRYARVRMRRLLPVLAKDGLTAARIADAARRLGRARAALDREVARLLARAAWVHPAGHLHLSQAAVQEAPAEVALRALARCVAAVGGGEHALRAERLERLHAALAGGDRFKGRTLGGCRILRHHDTLLICREAAAAAAELLLRPGLRARWDGRFEVTVAADFPPGRRVVLRRLGEPGWRLAGPLGGGRAGAIPAPARAALPSLWDRHGLAAVPHLGYVRPGNTGFRGIDIEFATHALAGAGFTVA